MMSIVEAELDAWEPRSDAGAWISEFAGKDVSPFSSLDPSECPRHSDHLEQLGQLALGRGQVG